MRIENKRFSPNPVWFQYTGILKASPFSPQVELSNRLRRLRLQQRLTIEALAAASGVSRSMISLIERGEGNPSAGVLNRLAAALGIAMATLFLPAMTAAGQPVCRRSGQPLWRDPESGYQRRSLSPPGSRQIVLSEIELPPSATVSYANGERLASVEQQVLVLAGELVVDIGPIRHRLAVGDCVAMGLGQATRFANETEQPARYLIASSNLGLQAMAIETPLPGRPGSSPRR